MLPRPLKPSCQLVHRRWSNTRIPSPPFHNDTYSSCTSKRHDLEVLICREVHTSVNPSCLTGCRPEPKSALSQEQRSRSEKVMIVGKQYHLQQLEFSYKWLHISNVRWEQNKPPHKLKKLTLSRISMSNHNIASFKRFPQNLVREIVYESNFPTFVNGWLHTRPNKDREPRDIVREEKTSTCC